MMIAVLRAVKPVAIALRLGGAARGRR